MMMNMTIDDQKSGLINLFNKMYMMNWWTNDALITPENVLIVIVKVITVVNDDCMSTQIANWYRNRVDNDPALSWRINV